MDGIIEYIGSLNPFWVYMAVAGISYIENILPPFPSDIIVVAAGSLVGLGKIDFFPALFLATAGSTLGFITMYKLGDWFGARILEMGKIKFVPLENVHKVEAWFRKYGYWVIVANRFLAGTRAVVSFFAGISELVFWKTVLLSLLSALVWNAILLVAGKTLGENWAEIAVYLETYSKVVTLVVLVGGLVLITRHWYKLQQSAKTTSLRK